jgi:hypothetical protein
LGVRSGSVRLPDGCHGRRSGATAGEALDTLPDIVTVGPDMEGHFRIPYERLLGDNLLSDDQIYDLRGDENWSGQGNTWTESETLTYAKFTVVPIPAAVWLLGGGLIGLLGLRRRLKKE